MHKGLLSGLVKTKAFFATDVHGSDICFRKFLSSAKYYGAKVLILGGDITGKMIVPIVSQKDGTFLCGYSGIPSKLKSQEELNVAIKSIRDSGYYPYVCDEKQNAELEDPENVKKLFKQLMVDGIQR
jgi:Icc-related predicted phosphoesterase